MDSKKYFSKFQAFAHRPNTTKSIAQFQQESFIQPSALIHSKLPKQSKSLYYQLCNFFLSLSDLGFYEIQGQPPKTPHVACRHLQCASLSSYQVCLTPVVQPSLGKENKRKVHCFPDNLQEYLNQKWKFCHLHGKESREREEVLLGIGNVKT